MASGVTCADDVKLEYSDMKQHNKYKYMMFRLSDDKKNIIIEHDQCKKGKGKNKDKQDDDEKDQDTWEAMCATLKDDEPRYIVYDIHSTSKDGRTIEKLLFVSWCADNCPIKKRMIHAASEDYLKKALEGLCGTIIQAHDKGDLDYEEALKIVITRD